MVDNKTVGVSTLISAGIIAIALLVPNFFDEPQYYCDSRPELGLQSCDSFSKYVDSNGKCIKDDAPNLICRTGWILVANDMSNVDEPIQEDLYTKTNAKQYRCGKTCEEI